MARIRSVKPEFYSSPSTAKASAVARLAYMAMWNWADDFGRGTANLKELEGFAFPNDDIPTLSVGTSANFREVVAEVVDCYGVVFYTVNGRPYYAIPSWDKHQRNERSAKAKHPGPDEADAPLTGGFPPNSGTSPDVRQSVSELPHTSGPGTGEQGNRGTGEQFFSSDVADATSHVPIEEAVEVSPEARSLCDDLARLMAANGQKTPPKPPKDWLVAADRLLRLDGRDFSTARGLLKWAKQDSFWDSNILSLPTFRAQYDKLMGAAKRTTTQPRAQQHLKLVEELRAEEQAAVEGKRDAASVPEIGAGR